MNYELETLLRDHADELVALFRQALARNTDSGQLAQSFTVGTARDATGISAVISFNAYGRFAEIRSRRQQRARRNSDTWTGRNGGRSKKMAWYNRNRYRGYGRLYSALVANLTEEQFQQLRQAVVY